MNIEEVKIVDKVWGKEVWMVNCDEYCGKLLYLKKGYKCSIHHHKNKKETFFILTGFVLLSINGLDYVMNEGTSITIEPGENHSFKCNEDSIIIETSTHHEESDSYRLTKSGKA